MCNAREISCNKVSTLVFIDDAVEDFQSLVKYLLPSSQIIVIQPLSNEIEQITQTVNKYSHLKTIHIISNGSPGCLYFGNNNLSLFTLKFYIFQLKSWSVSNILIYGCNVAYGNMGQEFIRRLHLFTGANIGASMWEVNSTVKGVCFELNYFLGDINSNLTILSSILHTNTTIF